MLKVAWLTLLAWNVITLGMFWFDKHRSRSQGRRVPERTLLWSMFCGGFVGAWLAMNWFRHKTVKQPFRRWAMFCTVLSPAWLMLWWTWNSLGR